MTDISQAKPVIAIFCKELKAGGDPFSNDFYWRAYQDLLFALKQRGIEAYFATDNNSYQGFGVFDTVYHLEKPGIIEDLTPIENIHVDLVFDRGRFIGRDVRMVNPAILTKIARSKIEMYEYFSDLQPRSLVGNSRHQVEKAADAIESEKVVVKEPEGMGGNEVYIGTKEEVLQKIPDQFPVLVQEFLDTSLGIPGQVEGVHDARLGLCGSEIISYYVRSAEEGKLLANVAQGGTATYFDVSAVPKELVETAELIDGLFADQPRFYSLDFMNTPKGWKLVELNSYLGLVPASDGPEAKETLHRLADYLSHEAREQYDQKQRLMK